jgi:flagellar biosynthesis/type III secretory pathway chaperone
MAWPMQVDLSDIDGVEQDITALRECLIQEFDALKSRDMDALKTLEQSKSDLLSRLQNHGVSFSQADHLSVRWVQARDNLRFCRDLHFKNWQLLRRQIDVVQGTLQAMLGESEPPAMLYDRMGHMGGRRLGRPWQSA